MTFSNQEIATILAALRCYQEKGKSVTGELGRWIEDIATNGGTFPALDHDQIDSLCERINFSGIPAEGTKKPRKALSKKNKASKKGRHVPSSKRRAA